MPREPPYETTNKCNVFACVCVCVCGEGATTKVLRVIGLECIIYIQEIL
jgi:hypothetical protein